jgi:hypothetical protein
VKEIYRIHPAFGPIGTEYTGTERDSRAPTLIRGEGGSGDPRRVSSTNQRWVRLWGPHHTVRPTPDRVSLWAVPLAALVGGLLVLLWALSPMGDWSLPARVVFYVTTAAAGGALAVCGGQVWPHVTATRARRLRSDRSRRQPRYRPAPW